MTYLSLHRPFHSFWPHGFLSRIRRTFCFPDCVLTLTYSGRRKTMKVCKNFERWPGERQVEAGKIPVSQFLSQDWHTTMVHNFVFLILALSFWISKFKISKLLLLPPNILKCWHLLHLPLQLMHGSSQQGKQYISPSHKQTYPSVPICNEINIKTEPFHE